MVNDLNFLLDKASQIGKDERVDFDYVAVPIDGKSDKFDSFSMEVEPQAQKNIVETIKDKIRKSATSAEGVQFNMSTELGKNQIGVADVSDLGSKFANFMEAAKDLNAPFDKKAEKRIIGYMVRVGDLKIIRNLNMTNLLSTHKRKLEVGLKRKKIKRIEEGVILISPESMDVVCVDDSAYILSEQHFHFLFSGTTFLKGEVEKKKSKLEKYVDDVDMLINYAGSNANIIRGLYHIVTDDKMTAIDRGKISGINTKYKQKYGADKGPLVLKDGKLKCDEKSIKYVYWYLGAKFGQNLITEDLFGIGSSYPV